ncbi:hypothetical protein ACTXT7_008346 [Hymenolepis weldensis]
MVTTNYCGKVQPLLAIKHSIHQDSQDLFLCCNFQPVSLLSFRIVQSENVANFETSAAMRALKFEIKIVRKVRSIGVLAYFLLTGKSPFLAESKALTLSNITQMKIDYPPDLFNSVSASALAFIRALIQRNPRSLEEAPVAIFRARLTASQCCQHEWLRQHAEKVNQGEKVKEEEKRVTKTEGIEEVLKEEDVSVVPSSGEDESSSSDSSSISSPSRKRIALDDSENVEASTQATSKSPSTNVTPTPVSAIGTPLSSACCGRFLASRSVFSLEEGGIAKHHHHHHSRRRSVLASISPPPTLTEATSPTD